MVREERAHELFRFMALRGPEASTTIDPQRGTPAAAAHSVVAPSIERAVKENSKAGTS